MTETAKKNSNNWYVLYTSPRAEKQVKIRLEQLSSVEEVFLPIHLCPKQWSDRVKIVEKPLFNSYIFVRCRPAVVRDLLSVYGVSRIIFYNKEPAIVRNQEILNVRKFLELAANHELIVEEPVVEKAKIGDNVSILDGILSATQGKVLRIQKDKAVLEMGLLNAKMTVKLDAFTKAK